MLNGVKNFPEKFQLVLFHRTIRLTRFIILIFLLVSCQTARPKIECFDPNNSAADTSYFVSGKNYFGFIFPEGYSPMGQIGEKRFTPTELNVEIAESILASEEKFNKAYLRQYLGYVNGSGDSLVFIRLLKNGKKEECVDKMVESGYGSFYEKNQRKREINLTKKQINQNH